MRIKELKVIKDKNMNLDEYEKIQPDLGIKQKDIEKINEEIEAELNHFLEKKKGTTSRE